MNKKHYILSTLIIILIVFEMVAAIPKIMTYQGVMTDANGVAIQGQKRVTFRLYDTESEGSPIWMETLNVQFSSGYFSTTLGSETPLDLPFDNRYWISFQVEGDTEMVPRQTLTSVPYSFRTKTAENNEDGSLTRELGEIIDNLQKEQIKQKRDLVQVLFNTLSESRTGATQLENLIIDTFSDDTGIDKIGSINYTLRGASDYDVVTNIPIIENHDDSYISANTPGSLSGRNLSVDFCHEWGGKLLRNAARSGIQSK